MSQQSIIGVDLGGTKIRTGRLKGSDIVEATTLPVSSLGTEEQVTKEVIESIEAVLETSVAGIGVGVPSIVDVEKGIVYDVQNIPSWKEVPLKRILEDRFQVPVYINNDANCFAVGEKHFGKGKPYRHMIGLIVGTGMAGGIIIDHKLYNGRNCGAGEFGMMPYLDHYYEYYCSGQFFSNVYDKDGKDLFDRASRGDAEALDIFRQFGFHLGNGITALLYALDPEIIIMGGSVSKAYPFFKEALWERLQGFAYRPVIEHLKIEISEIPDIALLGAAALYYDAVTGQS
jgi:glucokinase